MRDINLKCNCGCVQGVAEQVSASSGTRLVCCCTDCQSFAHFLKTDGVLDEYGGTDIFQMPVSQLKLTQGQEQIGCMRLSENGLYRWYTKCCNTPIGNTLGSGGPFVGLVHLFMCHVDSRDADLGRNRGYSLVDNAVKPVPKNLIANKLTLTSRCLFKLMLWKLKGLNAPSVFFKEGGEAVTEVTIVGNKSASVN